MKRQTTLAVMTVCLNHVASTGDALGEHDMLVSCHSPPIHVASARRVVPFINRHRVLVVYRRMYHATSYTTIHIV